MYIYICGICAGMFPHTGEAPKLQQNPQVSCLLFFLQNFVQKCPFRPASGIFFMASLTFPMDPKRSPKFGVAARRGSGTVSSSRPCAVEPQKAQRIALPAQRQTPRPKSPPRKPRAMVTRWKKDEYRNVVTCCYMYVFCTIVQVMYSDVL